MSPGPADTRTASEPGAVIAGHRIVEVLSRGEIEEAFRTEAPDGTPATMQVLRRPGDSSEAKRFATNAALLSDLTHPSLPRVLGLGEAAEGLWVATAVVEGVSLGTLLTGEIAPRRAVVLLRDIADALDAAHRVGLTHGDVHPENVIVHKPPVDGATLVGFGLAPANGMVVAERMPYSAPEVIRWAKPEPASDIFALAAILYECLAGAPPFGQEHVRTAPEPLGPELPDSLNTAIARGLATEPAARPASASELIREAREALVDAGAPSTPRPPPTQPAREAPSQPPVWRRRALGALAAVLVVGGAGAAGYAVSRDDSVSTSEPVASRSVEAGAVGITVPVGWQRARPAEGGVGPSLSDSLSLRRSNPPARIAAGLATDRTAVLNPSRLGAEVAVTASRPRQVTLGRLRALRFEESGNSIVYVAPTSAGAATVTCAATRGALARPCAEAARGLAVRGARVYDPAAGIGWMNRLASDMRRLRARRAAGLRRLRGERTAAGQVRRAREIARIYAATARRLRTRPAPPQARPARRRILSRLLEVDRAYRSLAGAARATNQPAFRAAARRVRRADRGLQKTLRAL